MNLLSLAKRAARRLGAPVALIALALTSLLPAVAQAALTQRYAVTARGDIAMIGNIVVDMGDPQRVNNNNRASVFVNVDAANRPTGVPANSSSATLAFSGSVLNAQLYWGGRWDDEAERKTIQMKGPGDAAYTSIQADSINTYASAWQTAGLEGPYAAQADVTAWVKAKGPGAYFGGGIYTQVGAASDNDSLGNYGGWALVVTYADAGQPMRRMLVYDGPSFLEPYNRGNTKTETLTISGLTAPATGIVKASVGALVWEGDRDSTPDWFKRSGAGTVSPGALTSVGRAADDFWSSRISTGPGRNPTLDPSWGMDLAMLDVSSNQAPGVDAIDDLLQHGGDDARPPGGRVLQVSAPHRPDWGAACPALRAWAPAGPDRSTARRRWPSRGGRCRKTARPPRRPSRPGCARWLRSGRRPGRVFARGCGLQIVRRGWWAWRVLRMVQFLKSGCRRSTRRSSAGHSASPSHSLPSPTHCL